MNGTELNNATEPRSIVQQQACSAWWKSGWSRFVQSFEPTWTGSWKCHRGIQRRSRYSEKCATWKQHFAENATAQTPEAAETAQIKDSPAVVSAATCSPIADRYGWMESNRLKKFASWEDEIAHATAEGYQLVPPEYHIPHWSTAMSMGDALPKLYVMRMAGNFDELRASFDRPARDIAYPLFFRVNAQVQARSEAELPATPCSSAILRPPKK